MTLKVELVSPERILFEGEASMVRARTIGGGEIAFLTDHAPFLGALDIDVVLIRPVDGPDDLVAVHGGFICVQDNVVTILSDLAEMASQIDLERARKAQERALQAERAAEDVEKEAALRRANARVRAAGGLVEAH
jgi:F-type H+-transporting ATPase subunit epsilon